MRKQFKGADRDGSGTLDYDEFRALLRSVRGETVGPLNERLSGCLRELLGVSLQVRPSAASHHALRRATAAAAAAIVLLADADVRCC